MNMSEQLHIDWWSHGWTAFDASSLLLADRGFDPTAPSTLYDNNHACKHYYYSTLNGRWSRTDDSTYFDFALPLFVTQLAVVFILSSFFSFLLKPLRVSSFVPQIIGGLLIGPSLFTWLRVWQGVRDGWIDLLFPEWLMPGDWYTQIVKGINYTSSLGNLSMFGLMLFYFLVGVKMDPTMVLTTGKKATGIGLLLLIVPYVFNIFFVSFLRNHMGYPYTIHRLLSTVGASQAMTSFPVVALVLNELQILNSEVGRLALSSAMISDIGFRIIMVLTTSSWLNSSGIQLTTTATIGSATLISVVIYVFRPVFRWIVRQTPKGKQVQDAYVVFIVVLVILCGYIGTSIGQHVLFGPFLLGLAVPLGPPLGLTLVNKLETFVTGLLLPAFLVTSGLRVDLFIIQTKHLTILSLIMFLTFLVKLASVFLPAAMYCQIPAHDSLALALILGSKGIIDVAIVSSWKDTGILDSESFATTLLGILLVAAVVSPLVRFLYDPMRKYSGYLKRTIQDTRRNTEFRIIACVHEEEHVPTIIKLLQASNPTKLDPIYVYLLHLVELLGGSAPLLISHQLWKTTCAEENQSQRIISAFKHYEKRYAGALTVQPFTAISPKVTMHDDICMLALSKRASFIIIPFHQQYAIDGSMYTANSSIRTINKNVLNRAPCSVGLLVDRGNLSRSAVSSLDTFSYRAGLLFLGGDDDREALALVERMAENPCVKVEVLRLVASNNAGANEWQMQKDDEAIEKFKRLVSGTDERHTPNNPEGGGLGCLADYVEHYLDNGEELVEFIHTIKNDYDLILVGRRFGFYSPLTSGLSEWSECPELGVLGDVLASSDIKSACSVLVVQQQITGSMIAV